ncbi:hypothetical protein RB195_004628 [Necator americanus]|uniref:HEAT repeat protein n=1 Tax=Necator americanus TaxID=51031 RepID=A0ABR1BIW3_NECAM
MTDSSDDIVVEHFDPNTFTPLPLEHIRPPWNKYHPLECDAKHWEIFVEALESFDQDTILEGKDDFIVTIETLLPYLAACFSKHTDVLEYLEYFTYVCTVVKLVLPDCDSNAEKDICSRVLIWLEVCLSKDVQAFEEVKKLRDIAFNILKAVANSSRDFGQGLIESGLIELLVEVIEDPGCADVQVSALHSLFQLISSPTIWRETNNRLCEDNFEDPHGTLYSRLVAVTVADNSFPCKKILKLITLIVSWSRFVTSLTQLEVIAKDMFSKISNASCSGNLPVDDITEKWYNLQISLDLLRDYIIQLDDSKTCATFDVYAVLHSSGLLDICVKLLSIRRVVDNWPDALHFIWYLLCDRYYGTLYITDYPELSSLFTALKKLAENQQVTEASMDPATFNEGVWEFDDKFPEAKEVHLTLVYRLYALHLLDRMRGCSATLRHCIDDDQRLSALISLCELCNEANGRARREVIWILAQKYIHYISDAIELVHNNHDVRSSTCFTLSVHLLALVVAEADDPKFWIKQTKTFSHLVAKGCILPSDHRRLSEYLSPFSDQSIQHIGDSRPDVIAGLFEKISAVMVPKIKLDPAAITYIRAIEAALFHTDDISRLEMYHTMGRGGIFEGITTWLFELVQYRHVMWQMGEPLSSEDSKTFLTFALPVLRIFAAYFRTCGDLVGQIIRKGKSRRFMENGDHFVELRPMNDILLDSLFLMWSTTGGANGQNYTEECKTIRSAVLNVLTPSLFIEKPLSRLIRHILLRSCARPHLFPAALSLLTAIAPWAPPLFLSKTDVIVWKDVVIGHRQRVKRFVNAFISCENRGDIAEVLLSPNAYISEMSLAFVERMSALDYRLTHDLVRTLMKYIATSIKCKTPLHVKDKTTTGSSVAEDEAKQNEVIASNHASSFMVRMIEALERLCGINNFRIVLHYFLSQPRHLHLLLPILCQFERPTLESGRQQRFQTAVLDLITGICTPSFWRGEQPDAKGDGSDFVETYALSNCGSPEAEDVPLFEEVDEVVSVEATSPDGQKEPVEGENEEPLEVREETEDNQLLSNCLEAIMLALCRMLNDAGQKISIVQQALVMLKDAISSIEQEENSLFLNIMRICMMRVGLRPLFERLSQSFESEDIMTCLSGITVVLDKVAGDKAAILQKILGFSPSEHPLTSIISHVNSKDGNDETVKCVQQILDKFFQSLNDGSLGEDSVEWEDLTAPMVYGKITDVVKLYSKPLVQVLDSVQKVHEKTRAVSRILVHQKSTPGTRMGSEVAKVIEDSKGKEKAVLKILKSKMDLVDDDPQNPRKKPRIS